MEEKDNIQVEGYLQKRFQAGIVKTLKKKWYVLKDGELRSYQSEVACQQNAEMYQERVPVCNIQTVRIASVIHGVEVVTQQKVFILVASSVEDQQKWIKAIYETMKDNRPRSVSCPEDNKTSPSRKISSTGPKFGLTRMLSDIGIKRKSMDKTQGESQSQFYVDPETEKPLYSDVGVQADVQKPTSKTPEENKEIVDEPDKPLYSDVGVQADVQKPSSKTPQENQELVDEIFYFLDTHTQDITVTATGEENVEKTCSKIKSESGHRSSLCYEGQLPSDNSEISSNHVESSEKEMPEMEETNAEQSCSQTEEIKSDRSSESGHDSGPCPDSDQLSNNSDISNDQLIQVDTLFRQESFLKEEHIVDDDEAVYDSKEDKGILGLEMLLNPKIDKEDGNADGLSVSDGDGDDDDGDYSDEYEAHEGKSAFDKLRELLS